MWVAVGKPSIASSPLPLKTSLLAHSTPDTNVKIGDTTASTINFSSTLDTGKFSLTTMIIDADGEITNEVSGGESETLTLTKGDCKFNIELKDWDWCNGSCNGGTKTGEFIDVTVEIKGTSSETTWNDDESGGSDDAIKDGDNVKGNMGGSIITLSNTVTLDGKIESMPSGYPMIGGNGKNKNTITFRFPKFTSSAVYDPIISKNNTGLSGGAIAGIVIGALAGAVIIIALLKYFQICGSKMTASPVDSVDKL